MWDVVFLLNVGQLLRFDLRRIACGKPLFTRLESSRYMQTCMESPQRRRGTRVQAQIPVRLTSLDPSTKFSESCHTVVVNPLGCGVRFSHPLEPGMQVRVDDLPGRACATARVVNSIPLKTSGKYWLVGICLEQPANWWRLAPTPQDWDPYSTFPAFVPGSRKTLFSDKPFTLATAFSSNPQKHNPNPTTR
jgi:hypothetical protein